MVKIKKTATLRHEATLSPMISDFVKATASIPLFQLPAHLASFPRQWPFPRGDLYHWIPVVNRFDRILELFNQEYGLASGPQTQPFERRLLLKGDAEDRKPASEPSPSDAILDELHFSPDGDRELVEQILSFTRLLLENCGNRSLYASSGHLNNLLNTTSISLLKSALRLSLRLAQRFHASRLRLAPTSLHNSLLASHYNINLEKVHKLASPFTKGPQSVPILSTPTSKGKEKAPSTSDRRSAMDKISAADLVSMVKDDVLPSIIGEEWGGVLLSYYEAPSASGEGTSKAQEILASPVTPKTPTPVRRASNLGPSQTPRQNRTVTTEDSPTTPTGISSRDPDPARSSGLKVFELPSAKLSTTPAHELVKLGLSEVPEAFHYEVLHKIRVAKALGSPKSTREDIVAIRLLAIANLAYIHLESTFQQKIGQQDSDEPRRLQLAYQLSELVHPPGNGESGISRELQTYALSTLEALTKHKSKSADVCTALNVNVNHGVLFYVVRKAVAELGVEEDHEDTSEEDEWREALFSLLNNLPNAQPRTGEAMVSAGLLEILVEVLTLRTMKAERNHPKVLNFLDTFVYNLRDAFQAMVNAKGLDVIADLTAFEVETSQVRAEKGEGMLSEFKTQLTDYQIPFHQQQTLRWLFKFMNHMMSHTGGTFDRLLRNLIDSPQLLRGLRTVIANASIFGSTVWSMAVNILTSFIHNEPTSYQVIAEAGLSKAFLETVTQKPIPEIESPPLPIDESGQAPEGPSENAAASNASATATPAPPVLPHPLMSFPPRNRPLAPGILPVAEAISTVPQAYGAICLTEAGMKLFRSSEALSSFFEIFESPAHVNALDSDPDIPTMLGNSFDELVRHHPPLKDQVLASVLDMVARVSQLCFTKAVKGGVGAKLWVEGEDGQILVAGGRQALMGEEGPIHQQIPLADQHANTIGAEYDIEMPDVDEPDHGQSLGAVNEDVSIEQVVEWEDVKTGPTTTQFIGVVSRFLGGFFSNNQLCASFIESGGLEFALDFATLPCLPYKFNETMSPSEEVSRVIQLLVEQKPHLALPSLIKRAQNAVGQLEPLMRHTGEDAFFAPFTGPSGASKSKDLHERQNILNNGTKYAKSLVTIHTLCNALSLTFQAQMFNHRSTHNIFSQVNLADMYARLIDSLGRLHRSCVWEEILLQKNMPSEWEKATRIKSSGFGTDEADDILRINQLDRTPSEPPEGSNDSSDALIQALGESTSAEANCAPSHHQDHDSVQFKNTQTLRYLLSKVPTAVTPFLQSLGKLLLFRRSLDSYQKQCAVVVADQLAKAALDQLLFDVPKAAKQAKDRYAYWIVILTSVSQLIIDNGMDRGYPQALTLVLQSFKNQGGFTHLSDILESFYDEATSIIATQGDEKLKDAVQGVLNLSLGGIKIILAFYAQIINSKLINEAGQTASMQSRPDRDRDKPDFFLPAQFLVELRTAVIKPVQKIWNSDLMDKATTSIVKTLISILKTVLDGETEQGAYKRSDKPQPRGKMAIKTWKVRNADNIQRLKDFDEGLAREALYRCCDSYVMAREYCLAQVRDTRVTRNPIPSYEAKTSTSPSPIRADIVVPDATDIPTSSTGDHIDSEAPEVRSAAMEDVADDVDVGGSEVLPTLVPEATMSLETYIASNFEGPSLFNPNNTTEAGKAAGVVTIDDLDEERVNLRKNLIDRSLDVLNLHDDVTFELSDLISAAVSKAPDPAAMRGEIGSTLVQSLISLQGDDFRSNGKKIAASAHLLALVLQDKDFYEATVDELKENFSTLLGFIKIFPNQQADEPSPWIGQVLLIIERLLAEDSQPHQIQWSPPNTESPQEDNKIAQLPDSVVSLDEKSHMFDAIMEVLPRIGKDESLALSIVRVVVMLTRTRRIAVRLGEKRNIQRLFLMVKQLAGITNERLQSAFMLVLRHIIEDDTIIRQIMRSEIQAMFEGRDRRQTDTTAYTRQMYHLALRAPEIFVEVTNEKLTLPRFDPNQRPQALALKKEEKTTTDSAADESAPVGSSSGNTTTESSVDVDKAKPSTESKEGETLDRTKTQDLKPPVVENPDGVIHYLLCELLAYKDVDDKEQPAPSSEKNKKSVSTDIEMTNGDQSSSQTPSISGAADQKKNDKVEFKADSHPIYIYRCFILQCLTELLSSYNRTKIEFINFSRKADPHVMTPSKPRSGVLNYLLNVLVPVGTLNHAEDLAFKKRHTTSSWAVQAIVSLCATTGENGYPKSHPSPYAEEEPELLFVRKFVLEHALKAFKDASLSDEPLDMRYSRLMNLADIFYKMLQGNGNSGSSNRNGNSLQPSQKQLAKIMYEKNFISVLTTSIADIDLNFPNAKRAVKYILRPLRYLTETAYELSTKYEISTPGIIDDDEISTASSVDEADPDREETPDLFRNSTLGMFEPGQGMESDSESSDDDDDDEIYDEQYADDMEYDEDMGQDDEDVISEDEEMEGIDTMEGLPGDVGMDVEVVIDEDGEDDPSEDEDDSDEVDEDDENDDDIEDMDEVNGDDENGSLDGADDEDWASEDEDQEDYPGQDEIEDAGHNHPATLNQIMQVLENHGDVLDQIGEDIEMDVEHEDYMEDEMQDEEDDEDDEDDYEDEDIVYNPGLEDDDDTGIPNMGWDWENEPQPHALVRNNPHRISPWMFPGSPNDRILVPAFRAHRPGGAQRGADDGTNPLLQRSGRPSGAPLGGPRPEAMSDWVHAIDPMRPGRIFQEGGPVSFISNLLNAMSHGSPTIHQHNGALHLSFGNFPLGVPPPFDPGFRRDIRRPQEQQSRGSREDPAQAVAFLPTVTTLRWQDEARILFGNNAIEKSQRVINAILKLMVPPAIEAAEQRAAEQREKAARKAKEEAEQKEKEKKEREAKEKREREEREAAEAAEAEAQAAAAAQASTEPHPESQHVEELPENVVAGQEMEGVEAAQPATTGESNEAEPSESASRITTTIRGRRIDITGMGIDLEYLEALPEDLREEVLMQQLAEQRSQAAAAGEEPTDISREFLEALPADIREELLQQEAQERRRRERDEQRRRNQANGGPPPRAEEMDAASFLASLEPGLRQAVLMDQDEDMLAQLPPEIAVEARALGGDRRLSQFHDYIPRMNRARGLDRGNQPDDQNQKRKARPCVQMLDKAGVATLLRLMFIPQTGSSKQSLNTVLKNVCENRQNRAEVISILLSILQDGSADINAVERSFTQLSLRAKQPPAQKTPQPLKRTATGPIATNSEMSPLMVVQQCLSTLVFLTGTNLHVSSFFLSEHETAVGFKSRANRKGKAKETKATRYPLNALLSLLDRKLIVESSSIMEQLATLLCTITQPLNALVKKDKEKPAEGDKKDEAGPATSQEENTSSAQAEAQNQSGNTVDTEMTSAPEVTAQETPQPLGEGSEVPATSEVTSKEAEKEETEDKAKKPRTLVPPDVPDYNLQLVANILAARECSSKTFKDTLSVINNLSPIPGAKEVFGKELIGIAQALGQSILIDLQDLTTQISKAESPTDVQGMALSKFSPASSDQAKLLRVLTALDYLFDPKRADIQDKPSSDNAEALASTQKDDILTALYENSTFGPLWTKLSDCLAAIRQRGNMLNVATILLPLIEVLMVVCKNTTLKDAPLGKTFAKDFALSSPPPESKMETLFFTFTEDHRKILNDLVRQNPKLMSGSFSLLVKNSKVLEFDNKRNYFNRRLHARGTEMRHPHPPLQLAVRRDQVFLDSFKSLYFKTADEMKYGKLSIRFHGEEGVDAGGVTREWFQVLSRQMFNPDYALFVPVASDRTTFHPNRLSAINQEHLMFFKFIGRIIGKALYEGRVLDCHFSRAVYKRILGKSVSLKDMETLDLEYYKSLLWMLENDITDIITETFSTDVEAFGETQTVDLIENGRNIPVTEENKHEYVRLVTEHRLTRAVQEQLEHFLKGFHDIVPAELISIFSEQELELLISGLPDIDVEDWKNNTEYHNYTAGSPQIQWFWRAVRSFDKEERAKLLQFVTGTSKVPLNGFRELEGMNGFSRFNIHRDYGSKDRLPSSHTCFNQLDLPEYDTYETLRQQLYTAMTAGSEYFGFA